MTLTRAWNNWYHVTANPYGQWLRGDPRGWRERDHRLHVEGDYRHPPKPSRYNQKILQQSRELLKGPPVEFAPEQRRRVGVLILESFALQNIRVMCVGVGAKHLHALIQCPRRNPKTVMGKAKNHVWMQLINGAGTLTERTKRPELWAKSSHPEPIVDHAHSIEAFWYILKHRAKGAWAWCYQDPRDGTKACTHTRDPRNAARR